MSAGKHKRSMVGRRTVQHDPRHCGCLFHTQVTTGWMVTYSEFPHTVRTVLR